MHALRRGLTCLLVAMLTVPAWSESDVVGHVVNGRSATVRSSPLAGGSTLYSGDSVSAGTGGRVQISVAGGAQIEVLENSTIRLTRTREAVELAVEGGTASFTGDPGEKLEAAFGDATIRPVDGPVFGIIHIENSTSAVVIAQKGELAIATSHDAGAVTLREGQAARVKLVSKLPSGSPPASAKPAQTAPSGSAGPSAKKLAVVAVIVGGAAAVAGIVLAAREPSQSNQASSNEVSPYTPN